MCSLRNRLAWSEWLSWAFTNCKIEQEPEIMGVITNRLVTLDSNMQLNLDDMDDELAANGSLPAELLPV